ncbi:RMD1 family protein [Rhodoplanes azumiensis]|uniref:RMD1 family protein n=1 Tax=Rhodoplanes azumiensis TaxID=1897628 RepID=A0ABW5AE08_9BRAD
MADRSPLPVASPAAPMAVPATRARLTARTLLLGDRIDTAGLERSDLVSTTPLAFRTGASGYAVLFRYGVAVLIGLSPVEEDELVRALGPRLAGQYETIEDESTVVEIAPDQDDQVVPGGPVAIRALTPPRILVIADVLAKNAALARDEREVGTVLEVMEPFAAALARTGRTPSGRRQMLRTIGQALQVQHRLAGRVEIEDKPDILWDQPEFERLWLRLADEYELKERATSLARKLEVIDDTARAITDIIDTQRSVRLEATIVLLIVVEVLVTFYELFVRGGH